MARLVYSMFASVDGYIEAPGHDIGWSVPDEELHAYANDEARASSVFLYGRRLYELMAQFWPTADAGPDTPEVIADFARVWRDKPKVVFSRTLTEVAWNSRLVRDDPATEIARLKRELDGELSVGGPTLAASVIDLVDEFRLFLHPVALGAGTPFFPDRRLPLRLIDTKTFGSGVVLLRYELSR